MQHISDIRSYAQQITFAIEQHCIDGRKAVAAKRAIEKFCDQLIAGSAGPQDEAALKGEIEAMIELLGGEQADHICFVDRSPKLAIIPSFAQQLFRRVLSDGVRAIRIDVSRKIDERTGRLESFLQKHFMLTQDEGLATQRAAQVRAAISMLAFGNIVGNDDLIATGALLLEMLPRATVYGWDQDANGWLVNISK